MSKAVFKAFYFLGNNRPIADLETELASCCELAAKAGASLKENLDSALMVANIPFLMAQSGATSQRLHSLLIAARINLRGLPQPQDEDYVLKLAKEKADRDFASEMKVDETRERFVDDVIHRLEAMLSDPSLQGAARELLNQTLVMIWGAFEVFVTDVVRAKLNDDPRLAVRLVTTDPSRKHFRKDLSIETLAVHDFILKSTMGDILVGDQQLDSLPRMREILSALLPASDHLHEAMADKSLWLLWQKRHLIVHRRGVVDRQFIANTGTDTPSGDRLLVESDDVDEALLTVKNAAIALMRAIQLAAT